MYAALWRVLPGPVWLRVLMVVVLAVVVVLCLIEWVFPWVNSLIPVQEVTVNE